MTIWFTGRAREAARLREMALDRELYHAQAVNEALTAQLEECRRRETYWRTRAEKFMDQIALRNGNISEPTMSEMPPGPPPAAAVFGAFARTEINLDKAGPDRLRVNAVDTALAAQLVSEALNT